MQPELASPGRKPPTEIVFHYAGRSRRNFLAQLRHEVAILQTIGFDHEAIGDALGITQDDARLLSPFWREKAQGDRLTRRALKALLSGRHAHLGGKTIVKRAQRLLEIATAYTAEELGAEPGIGASTVMEIRNWLEVRGLSLRKA